MSLHLITIVTLIYFGVMVSEAYARRWGWSLAFAGYALANVGIMWAMK